MLNQTDFYISCNSSTDAGTDVSPKLTRFLMQNILPQYAEDLKKQSVRPFSVYSMHAESGTLIRLSTLNDQSIHLSDVLARKNTIQLDSTGTSYAIQEVSRKEELCEEDLFSLLEGKNFKISLITPAVYKASGTFQNNPALQLYFYSVISKINMFSEVKINHSEFLSAYKKMIINSYSLSSTSYLLSRSTIPAMTGELSISIPSGDRKNEWLLKTVFAYAVYSGIGSNTSLGMGGLSAEPV